MCSSGRRSGSGRGLQNVPIFRKVTNAGSSGRGPGRGPLVVSFWGVSVFLSRWLLPISSSTAASVCVRGHRVCSRSSAVSWRVRRRDLHNGRGRDTVERWHGVRVRCAGLVNTTNSLRQRRGCPVCSTSQGQPPTWCDLWRCREMITKLLVEGVRRGIPGGGGPQIFTRRAPTPELATTGRHFYAQ